MAAPIQPQTQIPAAPPAASAASANTYTNLSGLAALKANPNSPQNLHAVAQQVDALFLQMMLKSMRDAAADVGEPQSNEMGMYQDMFDKQVALSMSQHQDLGLGSMFTRQLAAKPAQAASAASPVQPVVAPPGAASAIAKSAVEFVNRVLPTIKRAAAALGVSPMGMLAQAALETGWGRRMPQTADGSSSLNLFGVKAGGGWDGARATAHTLEFKGGVAALQRTAFRAYGSIQDSVNDFANLLQSSPRYSRVLAAGGTAPDYVRMIGNAGYASDPQYADKLTEILNGGTLRAALAGAKSVL